MSIKRESSLTKKRDALIGNGIILPSLLDNILFQKDQPHGFALNLCGHCNARCSYCPQSFKNEPEEYISMDIIERLLASTKSTPTYFQFGTRGENLLHPNVFEIFGMIKKNNPKHYITVNTNARLMHGDFAIEFFKSGDVNQVIMSLQSLDRESYKTLTNYENIDSILRNIKESIEIRDRLNSPTMIGIQHLNTETNRTSYESFVEYWSKYDVYTYSQMLHPWGDKFDYVDGKDDCRYPCLYLWLYPNISHNGNVCSCFADFYDENIYGNIGLDSLQKIWTESKHRKYMIEMHLTGQWDEIGLCSKCNGYKEFENVFYKLENGHFALKDARGHK